MGSRTTAHARPSRLLPTLLTSALLPLALAAALLVAPTGPAPVSEPGLRPAAAALKSATYTTFTLNIKHDLGKARALEDMKKAFTLGDAGGFQEMSDLEDRQSLIQLAKQRDYGWYMPTEGGAAIPIVWNRARFRLIDGRTIKTHDAEEGVTPARYINVVRLREQSTGKVFGFINTHTIAQASYDAQASDMRLIPRLRKHLRMLRNEIHRLAGSTEHVFISGDLNVNYLADRRRQVEGLPTDALGAVVNFDMPLQGSRGPTSLLDYGMSLKDGSGLVLDHSRIVHDFNSDHDAVQLTYRPVDLFQSGPLFNQPGGTDAERRRVLHRQARAVMDAEPGALVRLATTRIDDAAMEKALLDAYAEGVEVRIVLGGGMPTPTEERLAAALGSDTAAGSWLVRCTGSCTGTGGRQETNVLLVSRAGGTTELTLVGSGPLVAGGGTRFTDTFRASTSAVYAGYGAIFDRMSQDAPDTSNQRVLDLGSYQAQLYPVAPDPWRDPVIRALKPVGCRNAHGLRTPDGRTNVRVSVQAWSGERGQRIAQRLGVLKAHGCDVAVVMGSKVLAGIRRELARADIPTRTAPTGQNLLVVDGRYGKRGGAHLAWTGGPPWTGGALAGDGVTLVVPFADSVRSYLDGFSKAWRSG